MIFKRQAQISLISFLLLFPFTKEVSAIIDPNPNSSHHSNVVPPAPTVASLGKYGDVPINLSTGAPNLTIPLFELKSRNASLPISLSYSSNGIKVDAVASWVGMEWSLNAGGVISRTVRGGPDENSRCEIPTGLESYSPSTVDFLLYQWDHTTDTEPDIFHYNFDGYCGKFIIDVGNQMKVNNVPYNNLKFEIEYPQGTTDGIYAFIITTPAGTIYTFGENFYDSTSKPKTCNYRTYNRGMKTAWHLKKITYPTGEVINLSYKFKFINYYTGISQTIKKLASWTCLDNSCPGDEKYTCTQYLRTKTYHLEKITTSAKDSIIFYSNDTVRLDIDDSKLDSIKIYNSKNNLVKNIAFYYIFPKACGYTYNNVSGLYDQNADLKYRMFLEKVQIAGGSLVDKQKYTFDYYDPTRLPGRLSFSQDHWGYYNEQSNHDFVVVPEYLVTHPAFINIQCDREPYYGAAQAGLLKTITYPTGGSTTFTYEQNTYSAQELIYPPLFSVFNAINGLNCYDPDTIYETYTVPVTQSQFVHATLMFDSSEYCGFMKNRHVGKISVYDNTTSTYLVTQKTVHLDNPLIIPVIYDSGHVYTARIIANGAGTETNFGTSFYLTQPTWQLVEKYAGGMRMKRTTDIDYITGKSKISRYFYGSLSDLNVSSGVSAPNPNYSSSQTVKKVCSSNIIPEDCIYMNLYSNSVNDLFNVNGHCIMYHNVIKSFGEYFENGGESSTFLVEIDDPGMIVSWSCNNIMGATQNNLSWNNGQLEEQLAFKYQNNEFVPVKKTTNIYSDDARKDTTLHGFVFRKTSDPILSASSTYYQCTQEDVNRKIFKCTADHDHWFYPGPNNWVCIAPGSANQLVPNSCTEVGQQIPVYTTLDNYDGMKYDIYIKWNHLDTVKTKTYSISGNDSITETTIFKYYNPEHALPNLTKNIDSKGDTIKIYTYYPQDYTGNFQSLIGNHIIEVPIDKRHYLNSKLTNGQVIKYNDFGQPLEIFQARNELGSNLGFNKNNPYSYGIKETEFQYDANSHNIHSYMPENKQQINFLWAYKSTYPIAEIMGSNIDEVNNILQQGGFNLSALQESINDALIMNATTYLRNNLPGALVVSYTYDPQIGITAKTDAAGIETRFEYDTSGRLHYVYDKDGNIVKKYDYHYVSQIGK